MIIDKSTKIAAFLIALISMLYVTDNEMTEFIDENIDNAGFIKIILSFILKPIIFYTINVRRNLTYIIIDMAF